MLIERPASDLPPPHPAGGRPGAVADPIDAAVADLRAADRAMARVLRSIADAGPADGLPARRHVALRTGATRGEVAFLERTLQVLSGMPRVWAAFDDGGLSWSQVRAITMEARRLSVAQRGLLDEALAGALAEARDRGEPDRVVEVTGDLVARLDAAGQEAREAGEEREQRLVLQPDLDGGGEIHGYLGTHLFAVTATALDAAADAPVDPDAPPVTDDDDVITLLTDDDRMPIAIGDSHAPITPALRRAVTARDQGCRMPGCSTPADWCDVHHVIPRERGGPTSITNTCLVCRRCHVRLARHRWQMTLHDDATLTVTIGRHTYRTRPRL